MEKLPAEIRARISRMITRNAAFMKDMARCQRRSAPYFAEVLMEARLLTDYLDGRIPNMKRLIGEVVPGWCGASSAKRILHRLKREGMIEMIADQDDMRAVIVLPTPALIEKNRDRWQRVVDDLGVKTGH
ncbi:MAG: hypothetical protein ACLQJR_05765 [Stellaceae bacterium]